MMNIVLHEPEQGGNVGNIGRTCVATGSRLHLIEPLGFSMEDKYVKRAGLDYWDKVDIRIYRDIDEFRSLNEGKGTFWYFSTKASRRYSDVTYKDGDFLIFGKESAGLSEYLIYGNSDNAVRIPMGDEIRSLNLANSVAVAVYESLRQTGYPSLW